MLKRQAQKVFEEIKFGEDEKAQTNTFVLPVLLAEDKVHVHVDIFVLFCDTCHKPFVIRMSRDIFNIYEEQMTKDQIKCIIYSSCEWQIVFIVYRTVSLRLNLKNKE